MLYFLEVLEVLEFSQFQYLLYLWVRGTSGATRSSYNSLLKEPIWSGSRNGFYSQVIHVFAHRSLQSINSVMLNDLFNSQCVTST